MTKIGPRDDTKVAAIKLEWWPRSDWNKWPPSLESAGGQGQFRRILPREHFWHDRGRVGLVWKRSNKSS